MRLKRGCKPGLQTCLPTQILKGFFSNEEKFKKLNFIVLRGGEGRAMILPKDARHSWCGASECPA